MFFFFFFKQKTAYEIMPSLVGSEMCIRDRSRITYVKLLLRRAISSLIRPDPSSSDGLGGIGPEVTSQRFGTCSTAVIASLSATSCRIRLDRPTFRILPKILCCDGRLKSASIRTVLCPAPARTTARFAAVRDFPSPGPEEVTTIVLSSWSMVENRRLVRSAL